MALETIGLGGILSFTEKAAVVAMKRAHKGFVQLKTGAQSVIPTTTQVSTGMGRMAAEFRVAGRRIAATARAMAAKVKTQFGRMRAAAKSVGSRLKELIAPFGAARLGTLGLIGAVGIGIKQAADFEQSMAGVGAVTLAGAETMDVLADKAREMGIVSAFSATESGQAMEFMARAGFNATQIMGGLEGVMNAAAAEGIGLAETTGIVADTLKGYGFAAEEAARVSDILALTSARTNTTILGLGEGLKFAIPIAKKLGVSFEETAATLGFLADIGLKGTTAGTAFKNALLKLAKPTGSAKTKMEKLGLTVKDASGDFVGMTSVLTQLQTGMSKAGGAVDQTAAAAEIFGLRGIPLTSIINRMQKATAKGALTFGELVGQLENAQGAAKEMAERRLKTLTGSLKLLISSIEGVSIALFGALMLPMAMVVRAVTLAINSILFGFRALDKATEPFRLGIKEGLMPVMDELKIIWESIRVSILGALEEIGAAFGFATEGMQVNWREVGRTIGAILGAVISTTATVVSWIVRIGAIATTTLIPFGKVIFGWVIEPFRLAGQFIGRAVSSIKMIFSGNVVGGLKRLGAALVDFLLSPMRLMLRQAIKFAEFLPGIKIPEPLKKFAEEGITGFLFPEEPKAGIKVAAEGAAAAGAAARDVAKARTREKAEAIKAESPAIDAILKATDAIEAAAKASAERKTVIDNKIDLHVNGREAAYASAEHTQEIQERAGFKATPWQRRLSLEHGLPMPALVAIPRG